MRTKHVDKCGGPQDAGGDISKCWRCGKDLRPGQKRRWVRIIDGGSLILHPASEADYTADSGDCGSFPVGCDCAKQIGLEWSTETDL